MGSQHAFTQGCFEAFLDVDLCIANIVNNVMINIPFLQSQV